MNRNLSAQTRQSLALALSLACSGSVALGELVEGNILLVWNHFDSESMAIKNAYVAAHPGVATLDLALDYALYPPNSVINSPSGCSGNCDADCPGNHECACCACPTLAIGVHGPQQPFLAIDKFHVTPAMYESHIRQPIIDFLADYAATHPESLGHEPIICLVTTRGLPAVITQSFDAAINHNPACLKGALESHLAKLNYADSFNQYLNHLGVPFKQWINTEPTVCDPDGGLHLKRRVYLTSRLDSDRQFDAQGQPYGTHVDAVEALIERSTNLTVNKYAVTIVVDGNAGALHPVNTAMTAGNLFKARHWCVYFDSGYAFLNGPGQPTGTGCSTTDPNIEGQYNQWQELVHVTLGRNHKHVCTGNCSEPICSDYVKWYRPHAAGFFESLESYNGVGLRYPAWPFQDDPPYLGYTHGSVLHWIGAGGSFTWGRVNGPDGGAMFPEFVIANLYEYGMSWGEAVWSGIQNMGDVGCPIGDPLARVVMYDPDVVPSGAIDSQDVAFVIAHWGEEGSEADIDGDLDVDDQDLDLVLEVIGRDANALPPIEPVQSWPPRLLPTANRCGDLTADGVVDQSDLAMFDTWQSECPTHYSGMYDVNHDGTLDGVDRARIVSNLNRCLMDANLSNCADAADYFFIDQFILQWGEICFPDEHWNSNLDVNCSGCIDSNDSQAVQDFVKHEFNCQGCDP